MTGLRGTRLHDAYDAAKLTIGELWLRYFALGGEASEMEIDAYLNGAMTMSAFQHDMLAHAINERLDEISPPKAPYSDDYESSIEDAEEHPWPSRPGDPTGD